MRTLRIGVDAGGTFTDFVFLDGSGRLASFKLRSNPADPAAVILAGLERACQGASAEVVHGSTVATNALLERKGARTAFVTTKGFEDLVLIGRQNRAELYNLNPAPRAPLVERDLCFGVAERMLHDGTCAAPIPAAAVSRLKRKLRANGIESIALCFLHSYRNAANERAAAALLDGVGYLCCSHEVSPEFREYERSSTTLINAYVGPLMERYLGNLEAAGGHRISIMQSNGGAMTVAEARRHAVRTVLSGPAGGLVGAIETARIAGFRDIIAFDMGGTSTDVSLAEGRPRETTESMIDGFPIRVPMLDINTVGAGGGSIARVDAGGLLRVGPESAGAVPGPACYGVGLNPTVTDAHVVLGRIRADQFLAGKMTIEESRSEAAMERLAPPLGLDRVATADGILKVTNANMQRAIRSISVERGFDPRRFALVAFGGCGGLHAADIAAELGISVVLVPQHAGVLSALGMLLADRIRDYAAGALARRDFEALYGVLERQALRETPGATIARLADLRYKGQSYELTVPWRAADPSAPFHREHERAYGYASPGKPVEVVTLRVRATLANPKPRIAAPRRRVAAPAYRRVFSGGRWRRTAVLSRESFPAAGIDPPVLVTDYGSSTLIPVGWGGRIRRGGMLVMRRRSR